MVGCTGRMGHAWLEGIFADKELVLHAALARADSPQIGKDVGEQLGKTTGIKVTSDVVAIKGADVLIDFTRPEASLQYLETCEAAGVKMVIGTTGFTAEQKARITKAAQNLGI